MGFSFTKLFSRPFAKEMHILMVGLHAVGKTTILYKLKLGEIGTTLPTIGGHIVARLLWVEFTICSPGPQSSFSKVMFFSELVRTNELCQRCSDACVKLGREMGVKVVDLFTALQKRDDWMDACFVDGIYLSAKGSKMVVEVILKVIKEADWEPCLHWKSVPTEFAEDSPYDLVAADGKTTLNLSEWTFYREHQWD